MLTYQLDPKSPGISHVLRMARVTTHKSVRVTLRESHTIPDCRWSEGSNTRTSFVGVQPSRDGTVTLRPDSAVVESGIFRGKPAFVTVYCGAELFESLRPAISNVELTEPQRRVLVLTASYKSSARKDWRQRSRVSKARWDAIVAELHALGLVRKNGAISPDGRNRAATLLDVSAYDRPNSSLGD